MTTVEAMQKVAGEEKDTLQQLRGEATAEGAPVDKWQALVEKEKAVYGTQNEGIQAIIDRLQETEKKKAAAEERKKAAQAKIEETRAALDKTKEEKKAGGDAKVAYSAFIKDRATVQADIQHHLAVWKKIFAYPADALKNAPLDEAFALLDQWPTFEESTAAKLKSLAEEAEKFKGKGADAADNTSIEADFKELKDLYEKDGAKLLREQARRQDYAQSVDKLLANQSQLLHWCRQQRAALDAQKEPDHIQEFCASLQNNIGVMETNFLVIMEMAEHLVPNPQVEKALIEVAEVWMALEVFAYEKLRTTLVDLHQKSGLEGECKLWAEYSLKFKKFLESAEHLLEMPTDAESKAVTKPVLDNCKQMLADHDLHLIIAEHLSDFALREECVKDHYSAIRRTIFSKLTLLTQSFVGHQGYARKTEYTDRLAELSDWIECKSQNNAWKDLLARVDKMRKLVEANEVTSTDSIVSPTAAE
jgi:hypothetical protein